MNLYLPNATEQDRQRALDKLRQIGSNDLIHKVMTADLDWRSNPQRPNLDRLTELLKRAAYEVMLRKKRPLKSVPHSTYTKVWRIVDGAVKDALSKHPDYLTPKGRFSARESIVKRCTGAVKGFIER